MDKSYVIYQMVTKINVYNNTNTTLLLAPTGVAADNINSQTFHFVLKILPQMVR